MTTPGAQSWLGGWDEPGVLSVVLIAAGTTGAGLFVYSGTPAAGNLIYSITAAATGTDIFGNATLGGATSYGPSVPSGFQAISVNAGLITWYTATTTAGPWTSGPFINGEDNGQFTIDFSTAATDVQLALAANLFQVNAPSEFGALTGFEFVPGTGLTALNTSAAETWHTLTVQAPWTNNASNPLRYRLLPDGNVQWSGSATAAAQAGTTTVSAAPIPSIYWPSTVSQDIGPTFILNNVVQGVNVSTAGVVVCRSPSGTTTTCSPQGCYPTN
jgi:hypothetical protein